MLNRLTSLALVAVSVLLLSATLALKTVKIQTSAVCGMCKDRIEGALAGVDGVAEARLDMTTKKLRVKYDDAKLSEASLRAVVASLGYAADDVARDEAAFAKLPACCKGDSDVHGDAGADAGAAAPAAKACGMKASAGKACCASKAKGASAAAAATSTSNEAAASSGAPAAKACCAGKAAAGCAKDKAGVKAAKGTQ